MQQTKSEIMTETAQLLVDMIQKRLKARFTVLNALHTSPMDALPDDVKVMREIEAKVTRAVMQEQSDIIDIVNALFPNINVGDLPTLAMNKPDKKSRASSDKSDDIK